MIGLAVLPVAATIWEWSLPPISGKILFYGWVIISFAMLDLVADPLWCRKSQVEIGGWNLCQAVFWGSCLCTKLRYVLCHRGPLQGRISFHDQSLKCNARVLLPAFQYLLITLSSASSTFSIWGCAGPWGGVVWPMESHHFHSFPISSP